VLIHGKNDTRFNTDKTTEYTKEEVKDSPATKINHSTEHEVNNMTTQSVTLNSIPNNIATDRSSTSSTPKSDYQENTTSFESTGKNSLSSAIPLGESKTTKKAQKTATKASSSQINNALTKEITSENAILTKKTLNEENNDVEKTTTAKITSQKIEVSTANRTNRIYATNTTEIIQLERPLVSADALQSRVDLTLNLGKQVNDIKVSIVKGPVVKENTDQDIKKEKLGDNIQSNGFDKTLNESNGHNMLYSNIKINASFIPTLTTEKDSVLVYEYEDSLGAVANSSMKYFESMINKSIHTDKEKQNFAAPSHSVVEINTDHNKIIKLRKQVLDYEYMFEFKNKSVINLGKTSYTPMDGNATTSTLKSQSSDTTEATTKIYYTTKENQSLSVSTTSTTTSSTTSTSVSTFTTNAKVVSSSPPSTEEESTKYTLVNSDFRSSQRDEVSNTTGTTINVMSLKTSLGDPVLTPDPKKHEERSRSSLRPYSTLSQNTITKIRESSTTKIQQESTTTITSFSTLSQNTDKITYMTSAYEMRHGGSPTVMQHLTSSQNASIMTEINTESSDKFTSRSPQFNQANKQDVSRFIEFSPVTLKTKFIHQQQVKAEMSTTPSSMRITSRRFSNTASYGETLNSTQKAKKAIKQHKIIPLNEEMKNKVPTNKGQIAITTSTSPLARNLSTTQAQTTTGNAKGPTSINKIQDQKTSNVTDNKRMFGVNAELNKDNHGMLFDISGQISLLNETTRKNASFYI